MRKGFTLVEAMLASAILGFSALVLFEGVVVAARIAHENSEVLAAEAVAWDAVWKTFNVNRSRIEIGTVTETLADDAAPQLCGYDAAPRLSLNVEAAAAGLAESCWSRDLLRISADVEWGPQGDRHRLSSVREAPVVYRGGLGRAW